MEIKQAEFVTSMAQYGNFAGKGLPQIAVAGKSNVGTYIFSFASGPHCPASETWRWLEEWHLVPSGCPHTHSEARTESLGSITLLRSH